MKKLILLLIVLSAVNLFAAVQIPFSNSPVKTQANHLTGFVRVSPPDSVKIPLKTDVWLWHNKDNMFVLFESQIDKDFSKGRLAKRDEWIQADFVRFQVITDLNNYYAYAFYGFPLGNEIDGVRNSNLNFEDNWNSNYSYTSNFNDSLWTVLMKIPFKDLRFYGKEPYKWKIILTRYLKEPDEFYDFPNVWVEMGKDYFRKAQDIVIKEKIAKNKNYRITPYYVKKYDLIDQSSSFDPKNIGLDFSYNPTSATKLKLSLNPDFSDIPMDEVRNDFNVRYPPSYSENRYFFIEDLDVFGVGQEIFYSRNIMQPQFAIKLTGNAKGFSYGILSAQDKKTYEDGEVANNNDYYNLLAIKPKWKNSNIQITFLNRMNKGYHNDVLVVNPSWDISKNQNITFYNSISYKHQYNTQIGSFIGLVYHGKTKDWDWDFQLFNISEDFAADMGHIYETDLKSYNTTLGYDKDLNKKIIKSFGTSFWSTGGFKRNTGLLYQNFGLIGWSNFQAKFNIGFHIIRGKEEYLGKVFNTASNHFSISSWKFHNFYFRLNYGYTHTLVYNLKNVYTQQSYGIGFWGNLSKIIYYEIFATQYKYFDFPQDSSMDDNYRIGNINLTFNFTNKISLTNGLRYNNYEMNTLSGYLGFFTNFRYEFKKDCNIFLGYKTAQYEMEKRYEPNFKQAYMKVSYTF